MQRRFGTTVLASVFLVIGLTALAGFVSAWPPPDGTSPLAALFALLVGSAYVATAVLTWHGSRFAAPVFVAAIALLLYPARYLVPSGEAFLPSSVVVLLVALLGYHYLHGRRRPSGPAAAQGRPLG